MPIRHRLLLPKLLYFLLVSALCALSFQSLYLSKVLGVTASQIGLVLAIIPFALVIGNPLATAIADRTAAHKTFLSITVLLALIITLLVVVHPPFPVLLVGVAVVAILRNPSTPLLDTLVLAMLEGEDKDAYGQQRLWGSLACGLATGLVGWVIDIFHNLEGMIWMHALFLGGFVIALQWLPVSHPKGTDRYDKDTLGDVTVPEEAETAGEEHSIRDSEEHPIQPGYSSIPNRDEGEGSRMITMTIDEWDSDEQLPIVDGRSTVTVGNGAWFTFINPEILGFFASMFIMGATVAVLDSFLYLYLSEKMNASNTFLGIAKNFQVGLEIPMFYFSKPVLRQLGVQRMLLLAQAILVIRLLGYVFLKTGNVWFALPPELLHGVYFGILWVGAVRYIDDHSPSELKATGQGVLSAVYYGLAQSSGALFGGWWWDRQGGELIPLFIALAAINGVSLVLFAGLEYVGNRRSGWTAVGQHQ